MSFNITDRILYNLIQYTLLETPNNGASFSSGLYTSAELANATNFRLDLFNKLTGITSSDNVTDTVVASQKNQRFTNLYDLIDVIEVSYNPGSGWNVLPKGSSADADSFLDDQVSTTVSVPSFYTIDISPLLSISLLPPPSGAGTLRLCYIPKIGTLPETPDGTTIQIPDDFIPFIRYGVLASMFGAEGESSDPLREEICENLFNLGVEVTKAWVSGK